MEQKTHKLTSRQERFAREYLKNGFNAKQAALSAGYAPKRAKEMGYENLTKPHLQAFIQQAKREVDDEDIMTATEVLKELSIIGRSNIRDFITIAEGGGIQAKTFEEIPVEICKALESVSEDRAIKENNDGSSVTVFDKIKFKMHSKIQALDKLGQYSGLWKDKDQRDDEIPDSLTINLNQIRIEAPGGA